MQNVYSLQKLVSDRLDSWPVKRLRPLSQLAEEGSFAELKDTVDEVLVAVDFFENVQKFDKVRVIRQLFEQRNFSHGGVVDAIGHIL